MSTPITIPNMGESVTEATIEHWLKADGDIVAVDEIVLELETDKAAMEIPAPAAGKLSIKIQAGESVKQGDVVGEIDESAAGEAKPVEKEDKKEKSADKSDKSEKEEKKESAPKLSPAVRRLLDEHDLDPKDISPTGTKGNILKSDVLQYLESPTPEASAGTEKAEERVPMSRLRQKIAQRLVQAQQSAAILTTFNEVDMSAVKRLRSDYNPAFEKKHGIKLGFMSLFGRACIQALQELREVNAKIDGTDIIYSKHVNLGIAVGTPRGLVVPVVHKADTMTLAELEQAISDIAGRARDGKITPDDLSGGTFTISNGGVYGSLLSTPILNPPQTGILGMHKIEDRPVVVNGEIVVRPMMYLALSYDHRLIDGEQAVTFLVRVKGYLEDPARMLLEV